MLGFNIFYCPLECVTKLGVNIILNFISALGKIFNSYFINYIILPGV